MSARRRTRGQDAARPPKVEQPVECEDLMTVEQSEGEKPARGVVWRWWGGLKYLLLLFIVPPFLNYAALQRETTELRPPGGELYDVGWGQKMFLMCTGKGPPTVILDAATGTSSDMWSLVWPRVEKHARVCVYDRAGLGFSERPVSKGVGPAVADGSAAVTQQGRGQPFTAESMTDDLYQLITSSSQQPRPLILVGAELGALVSQFYTLLFDRDVAGVILLNPLPEALFDGDMDPWSHYWFGQLVPTYQSLQLAAALGVSRMGLVLGILKQPLPVTHLDAMVINRQNHLMCHPRHLSSIVDEHHFINETFSQMRTLRMLRPFPSNVSVTVMTGNYYDEQLPSSLNKAWAKAQQNLITKAFPMAQHIVVNAADRHMPLTAPDAIVEQVLKLVRHWKRHQPGSTQK